MWDCITFNSTGRGYFNYCEFKNGYAGIIKSGGGKQLSITNCTFEDVYYPISGYNNSGQQVYVTGSTINNSGGIYLYNSGAYIHGNEISGSSTYGIRVNYNSDPDGLAVWGNDIFNCSYGLYFYHGTAMVQMNDIYDNSYGVYCNNESEPMFLESYEDGLNVITDNSTGIYISSNSSVDLYEGSNTIAANSSYNLKNYNSYEEVHAEYNYWGQEEEDEDEPDESKFYGDIDYTPYLYSDETNRYPTGYLSKSTHAGEIDLPIEDSEVLDEETPLSLIEKYKQARQLNRSKNLTEANDLYEEIIDINPDHSLAVASFHHLIRNSNNEDKEAAIGKADEILNKHAKTKVAAHVLKYKTGEAAKAGQTQEAIALSRKIVKEFPELTVAKDAFYEEWVINFILLNDVEAAKSVVQDYESKYGLDENLIDMKLQSRLIDAETARDLRKQAYAKKLENSKKADQWDIPAEYALSNNYPNPFNPSTTISFALPELSKVSLKVYDTAGRLVDEIVSSNLKAGNHTVNFNGSKLASGLYIYKFTANSLESDQSYSDVKRMLLIK